MIKYHENATEIISRFGVSDIQTIKNGVRKIANALIEGKVYI
ncbi:MAG TPA: hypothetical protein VN939_01965 [Chthoniobacterales bacterium]|nr:hypothetical protein [Chthoniobacterales bacterium]